MTKLNDAARKGNVEEVRTLLTKPEDVNARGESGRIPLHEAAGEGHSEVVKLLLEKGADPNAEDEGGMTAVHFAAAGRAGAAPFQRGPDSPGHVAVLKLLAQNGANLNTAAGGKTPVLLAMLRGHHDVVQFLEEAISKPLFDAIDAGDSDRVKELVASDGDMVRYTDRLGGYPLSTAAARGNKEIVEILLSAGADVNAKDDITGCTALHMAAVAMLMGNGDCVESLLKRGADVNAKNANGETALAMVSKGPANPKAIAVRELLEKHGRNL